MLRFSYKLPCLLLTAAAVLIVILTCGTSSAQAQIAEVPSLSTEELATHLMKFVAPTYPQIAIAARVQGDVTLQIEIAPEGLVRSVTAVSGPAMLRQTAVSAVRQWRYQPFQKGNAIIAVSGRVLVRFTLSGKPEVHTPNEKTANGTYSFNLAIQPPSDVARTDPSTEKRFQTVWEPCTHGVIAHQTDQATADACMKAAGIEDAFSQDGHFVERRLVYVYTATALANIRDLQTALKYAHEAVEVVKLGHDDDSGSEAAYSTRGQIRALLGEMKAGDDDLSIAEDYCRKGHLSNELERDLLFHAELLNRMNRPQDAQAKLDEAAKLQVSVRPSTSPR